MNVAIRDSSSERFLSRLAAALRQLSEAQTLADTFEGEQRERVEKLLFSAKGALKTAYAAALNRAPNAIEVDGKLVRPADWTIKQEYHRTCKRKVGFLRKAEAESFLKRMLAEGIWSGKLNVYSCRFCNLWHIGRRRNGAWEVLK